MSPSSIHTIQQVVLTGPGQGNIDHLPRTQRFPGSATTVGAQIAAPFRTHHNVPRTEAYAKARQMLADVGISDPDRRLHQYPFELSGGMCQRTMVSIALICSPRVLVSDEPTTALEVTIQAQILDLMKKKVVPTIQLFHRGGRTRLPPLGCVGMDGTSASATSSTAVISLIMVASQLVRRTGGPFFGSLDWGVGE